MKNKNGFSTLEILISVGFLAGLIIVCTNIFKKQQTEMINAIQNIEITSTVNEIRMALKGEDACTISFENKKIGSKDIKVIKKIVQFPNTDEIEEIEAYPLFQYGRISFGEHKLMISKYILESISESKEASSEKPLKLIITFDKGLPELGDRNFAVQEIKIYASTDSLGRVESCSLGKKVVNEGPFIFLDGDLIRESGHVGMGTNLIPSPLTVNKGIQFFNTKVEKCEANDEGIIFRNRDELYLCSNQIPHQISNLAVLGL